MTHPWVIRLWTAVWGRYLVNDYYGKPDRVVIVKGWRTALVEDPIGNRRTITPMPKWLDRTP